MKQECGFRNCSNILTTPNPGAQIGYEIEGRRKQVHACTECAYKVMSMPRGTWYITKNRELKPIPAKPIIIT